VHKFRSPCLPGDGGAYYLRVLKVAQGPCRPTGTLNL